MSRRLELLKRKRKIELLLPVVESTRRDELVRQLRRVNAALGIEEPRLTKEIMRRSADGASGVDGVGGLTFDVQSPPGLGRLVRVPFLLRQIGPQWPVGGVATDGGGNTPAVNHPPVTVFLPPAARAMGGLTFETPVLEWATLRVVGFQADWIVRPTALIGAFNTRFWYHRPFLLVKNLMVSGGANLFSMEGYQDAAVYSSTVPELAGLRDYPIVQSPNFVRVEVAVGGNQFLDADVQGSATLSLEIVAEILEDVEFGRHISGPYARMGALMRTSNADGTSFIMG